MFAKNGFRYTLREPFIQWLVVWHIHCSSDPRPVHPRETGSGFLKISGSVWELMYIIYTYTVWPEMFAVLQFTGK